MTALGFSLLFLPAPFFAILCAYLLLNAAYTLRLRQLFLVDVLTIGAGFVLRVLGGSEAIGVPLSSWLAIAVFSLALLLGFAKRNAEICCMEHAESHRKVLAGYDPALLRSLILLFGATALGVYAAYAVIVVPGHFFFMTVPFVLFGLLQFLPLARKGGNPDEILRTPAFVANFILWLLVVLITLYLPGSS
jgi:4-hydroxybenzoate polyprenyltransferase